MDHPFDLTVINQFFNISEEGQKAPLFSFRGEEVLGSKAMKQVLDISGRHLRAHGIELPVSFVGNAFFWTHRFATVFSGKR
jgi:hypothetical protein